MDSVATTFIGHNPQLVAPADLGALKARQQAAWSSGDYARVGVTLQILGEELCEAVDVRSGQKVLDVAAEALPFPDGSFDVALSTFGVMFNRSRDGSMVVPGEYLEIVITRN